MELRQLDQEIDQRFASVNRAFSKQAHHYDEDDAKNVILHSWRQQVYGHVDSFLKPGSHILELNAGTGIDAVHFVKCGHTVHCTDISEGMIAQIGNKRLRLQLDTKLTCELRSFDNLENIGGPFDFVFSNFGGLNCIDRLEKVTTQLPSLLRAGALVTWVIMPPVSLWELGWMLKGHGRTALRRLQKNGTIAHLEGEYFKTYYHSLDNIVKAFGSAFDLVALEGVGALSPPPSEGHLPAQHPALYRFLCNLDKSCRKHFPFNRWADHLIVTMKYKGDRL
jgi:SAM-dependent methyltransferase